MIVSLAIILFLACLLSLIEERLGDIKWYAYAFLGLSLLVIAVVKPIGMDNDSLNYENYYFNFDNPLFEEVIEPTYRTISKFCYYTFHDFRSVLLIYALLGLTIKFVAFKKLSQQLFLVVAIYISNYYILHEFTQIRAGVASGLLLLAIKPLCDRKYGLSLLLILIAFFFHTSSAILLVLFFISNKDLSKRSRILWSLLIPLGYVFYFMKFKIDAIPLPYIGDKLAAYQELLDKGVLDEINVFNLVFLTRIAIYFFLLFFYDTLKEHNPYFNIMLKVYGISLFSFPAFSAIPVFSFRISELFGVVEIILFSNICYSMRPLWAGKLTVITIAVTLFCINVFYNNILLLI